MRISDWSSYLCSSDLAPPRLCPHSSNRSSTSARWPLSAYLRRPGARGADDPGDYALLSRPASAGGRQAQRALSTCDRAGVLCASPQIRRSSCLVILCLYFYIFVVALFLNINLF